MDDLDSFTTAWDLVSTELVLFTGLFVIRYVARAFGVPVKRAFLLYAWHTLLCFVAVWYIRQNGGDAAGYYHSALSGGTAFNAGTDAINFITTPLVSVLHLSFVGTSMVYQTLGAIGLLAFDASLRVATAGKHRIIRLLGTVIVLLPSVSFWSSLIGKDAISFLAAGLVLWSALNPGRRFWLTAVAVALMLMVRPHMAGIIVMALAGSFIVRRKVPLGRRLLLGTIALAASAAIVPYALNYSGLGEDATASDLGAYIEYRQQVTETGTTGINLSAMSPPMQLFAYLFRPLPYEAGGLFGLVASLDNVVLLLLFAVGLWNMAHRRRNLAVITSNRTFLWFYALLSWAVLAVTSANLGISLRQKWMFAPILIFLLLSHIGRVRAQRMAPVPADPPASPASPQLINQYEVIP